MWGMLGRCGAIKLRSLEVQVQLFDALVAPVLGYCAEVWGPSVLRHASTPLACMDNDLHKVQSLFMRRLGGGLRISTPRQLLLREFGCKPLVRGWLQSMLGMWNRVVDMGPGSLLKRALVENVQLPESVSSWFAGYSAFLGRFGGVPDGGLFRAVPQFVLM
jgi:hypothetical protein